VLLPLLELPKQSLLKNHLGIAMYVTITDSVQLQ